MASRIKDDNCRKNRGPYCKYETDDSNFLPRTSRWRQKKRARQALASASSTPRTPSPPSFSTHSSNPSTIGTNHANVEEDQDFEMSPEIADTHMHRDVINMSKNYSSGNVDHDHEPEVNPTDTDSDLDDLHAELDIMEHDVVDEANDPALDNISIDDSDIEAADLAEENYNQHQHDEDEDGDGEHIVDNPSNVSSDDESDGGRDQLPHTDPNQAAQESNTGDTLYKGSRLSLTLSVLLIATFVMRHGLSGECVGDLLTLIELHCLSENICITSLRMYNTFLSKKKASVVPHYFCEYCMTYFGLVLPDLCPVCRKACPKSRGAMNYFVVNPLNDILKTAFSRKGFMDKLAYRTKRVKRNINNIEDILDGDVYRQHFNPEGYFHGTEEERYGKEVHLSFQLNTDGVSIFKSNKTSLWPIYLVINELHPKLRYSRAERHFLGLWCGTGKPFFKTFLKPFAESFKDLYVNGLNVEVEGHADVLVRGVPLSVVMDSPARCLFQEFIQFNGNMGCPYCLAPGETFRTAAGGHSRIYPYNMNTSTGAYTKRTHEQTVEFAAQAQAEGKPVNGVKGQSWFLFLPRFNIIDNIAADYMHGLILGVMKMFLSLWFDKSYHREEFSISKKVKEVDRRLLNISPPNCISRMSRSIETHIKFWKASEYRSFLLFYAVPCLWGVLPDDYFQHFLLLNEASFILLSESISHESLLKSEKLLRHFCLRIECLYGKRYQTSNTHSLLHYAEKVRLLGPLWANSCFPFEDFNGDLRKLFHGTRGVAKQIVTAVCLQQVIPKFDSYFPVGSSVRCFYEKMTSRNVTYKSTEEISSGVFVIGNFKLCQNHPNLRAVVGRAVSQVYIFTRLFMKGVVVHSKLYWPGIKRNSFTIKFLKNDNLVSYGQIEYFIKCFASCANPVYCCINCVCRVPLFFAVIQEFQPQNLMLSSDTFTHASVPNVIPIQNGNSVEKVIRISSIIEKCIWVHVIAKDQRFITQFPNMIEKD